MQLELFDLMLLTLAFLSLLIGLAFKFHKNHSIFIFSCLMVVSDVLNPFLFVENRDSYSYAGWSAVRLFDFTTSSLIFSYAGSYVVYSLIILFSLPFLLFSNRNNNVVISKNLVHSVQKGMANSPKISERGFISFLVFLMLLYYPLYNNGVGITGVGGELPFHLSGAFHYIRTYLMPFLLVILLSRTGASKKVVLTFLLYSFVAGVAASSRFVGLLPVIFLIMYFVRLKIYYFIFPCLVYAVFIWFSVSTSRDLTFDGNRHDLFEVMYYSLTNINIDDIIATFDTITGRLSGAQQMVLVNQFRGINDCRNIYGFLLGESVCTDTAGSVYGLDLTGTAYGLGLSLIPSIVISSYSLLGYIFPAFWICVLICLSQIFYKKIRFGLGWIGTADLYLILSILFIFLGQLLFFYYLQFAICGVVLIKTYGTRLRF